MWRYLCLVFSWSVSVSLCLILCFHGQAFKPHANSEHVPIAQQVCLEIGSNPDSSQTNWQDLTHALESYTHFHSEGLTNTSVRTLTWSCFDNCRGLGDQFHQIMTALMLAIVTERVFLIHWEDSYKTMHQLQPYKINWSSATFQPHTPVTPSVAMTIVGNTPHVTMSTEIEVPFWRSYSRFRKVKTLEDGFRKIGLLDILKTENDRFKLTHITGLLLRYLFNFSHFITQLEQTQASIGLKSGQYVAVHIRTGFLGSAYEEAGRFSRYKVSRSQKSWEDTINCSLLLADKEFGRGSPVFLATDSEIVREWAVRMYGSQLQTTSHILIHSGNTFRGDKSNGVWIDFLILARAGVLVRGVSGFAVNAGALCSLPQTRQCTLTCRCRPYRTH